MPKTPISDWLVDVAMRRKRERAVVLNDVLRNYYAIQHSVPPGAVEVHWQDEWVDGKPHIRVDRVVITREYAATLFSTDNLPVTQVVAPAARERAFHALDEYQASMIEWEEYVAPVIREGSSVVEHPVKFPVAKQGDVFKDVFKSAQLLNSILSDPDLMTTKEYLDVRRRMEEHGVASVTEDEARRMRKTMREMERMKTENSKFLPTPVLSAGTAPIFDFENPPSINLGKLEGLLDLPVTPRMKDVRETIVNLITEA